MSMLWIGATVVVLASIELGATALYAIRDALRGPPPGPVELSTTARTRIRVIPPPNLDMAGFRTDRRGWRVERAGEQMFTGYSPADYNIVLFGGSTMWGWEVAFEDSIAAMLRSAFAAARSADGRAVRIYNAGLPEYSIADSVHLLADFLQDGRKIDLAVFYDGINEDCSPLPPEDPAADPPARPRVENPNYPQFQMLMEIANEGPRVLTENFKAVRLLRALQRRISGDETPPPTDQEIADHASSCARAYAASADFAHRMMRAWGADALFLLQPSGAFVPQADTFPFPKTGPLAPSVLLFYRELYRRIGESARSTGLNLDDLSASLDAAARRGDVLFVDWQHLSGRGNAIVSERIADLLVSTGRLRLPPARR